MSRQFVLLVLGLVLYGPIQAWASGVEQLRTFVHMTHSARASFVQSVTARPGRKPQHSHGTLFFSRPGKFRWVYEKPHDQLIVGDGEKLWIYDKELNQISVKSLGQALGSSPAALLAGDNAMEKNFLLKDIGRSDGLEMLDATPLATDSTFANVRIGFRDNLPRIMEIRDHLGQVTTLVFSRFDRNPTLSDSLFRLVPPVGADVAGE